MADYNYRSRSVAASQDVAIDEGLRAYMLRVYNYMLLGLALTGATAFAAVETQLGSVFFQIQGGYLTGLTALGWVALFAPIGFVLFLSMRIQHMSLAAAQTTFWVYAAIMGISLAPVLFIYTGASVARVFFITSAMFGATSVYGYTTKSDLSSFGSFLMMGLFGLIIASVVNIFLQSTMMQWVISVVGVLVFTGLTAYDTQRIKESYSANYDGTASGKMAIMGALSLYLDFINLFMYLLRFLGDRRN